MKIKIGLLAAALVCGSLSVVAQDAKAVMEDWKNGKDFIRQPSGAYVSITELPLLKMSGHTHIHFRYQNMTKVHIVQIP